MPSNYPSHVQSPSIDYLVASTQDHKIGPAWYRTLIVDPGRAHFKKTGHVIVQDYSYKGFHGHQTPEVKVAVNSEGYWLVWASGSSADTVFPAVAPLADKIARLDLAVTVRYDDSQENLVEDYYKLLLNSEKQTRKVTMVQNNQRGATLYVGSMKSAQFGRIYLKDVESGLDTVGNLVRYEVVYRDKYSTTLRDQMIAHKGVAARPKISATVKEWFRKRGVRCLFETDTNHFDVMVSKRLCSTDRTLTWLSSCVRPAIWRLLSQGHGPAVAEALGLQMDPYATQLTLPDPF